MADSPNASPPGWADAPFRNQPAALIHTFVYVLGDCLRNLKTHRDRTAPKTNHHNLQLVILACSFCEAALSRGLVEAAWHRLNQLPRTPENESARQALTASVDRFLDGDVHGNPFARAKGTNGRGGGQYSQPVQQILGLDLLQVIKPESASAVRCMFLLRNVLVHGQAVAASGVLPDKFEEPLADYSVRSTKNLAELTAHLRAQKLLPQVTLKSGLEFPCLNDAAVDYFLRALVEFFRQLQDAVGDEKLRHAFGAGIPQNIFPLLAGEAFEL